MTILNILRNQKGIRSLGNIISWIQNFSTVPTPQLVAIGETIQ